MKKRTLFFDCFYSFPFLLSPLSLSRLAITNKKLYKTLPAIKIKDSLEVSALNGQLFGVLYFIRSKSDFNWALAYAARGGHLEVCKYFIKLGATDFDLALAYAAYGGQTEICKYLIKLGPNDFNWALAHAAYGGHIVLCTYMIKLGANDFKWALANVKDEKTKDFLIQYIK